MTTLYNCTIAPVAADPVLDGVQLIVTSADGPAWVAETDRGAFGTALAADAFKESVRPRPPTNKIGTTTEASTLLRRDPRMREFGKHDFMTEGTS